MEKIYNSDVNNLKYNEDSALHQLSTAINVVTAELNDDYMLTDDYPTAQFTIAIGGVSTAFLIGGPQIQALVAFIDSLAAENGYAPYKEQ